MNTFDITMTATYVGERTDSDGWSHHKWDLLLQRGDRRIEIPFKMGLGIRQGRWEGHPIKPTLTEVLECLMSDCSIVENDEFDDICGDMPYSKAHRMRQALDKEVGDVKRLLGDDYEAFWTQEVDV